MRCIDMTGWVMKEHGVDNSRWTVIKRMDNNPQQQSMWLCRCECGNEKIVEGNKLRTGWSKSCGCYNNDVFKNNISKQNVYDLTGDYGKGWTVDTNLEFWFDIEDYELIKDYTWSEEHGYIINKLTRTYLHKLITHTDHTQIVDHVKSRRYDNRKSELRIVTSEQNAYNKSYMSNNTSGFIGVVWNKKNLCWQAQIGYQHKSIYLGSFDNKEDAIIARLLAEKKYFGEFAPHQDLFAQYHIE